MEMEMPPWSSIYWMILIIFPMMKKITWGMILLLLTGGMGFMCKSSNEQDYDLGALLPNEINGWKTAEEDKLYDQKTIFDYIDGAGEIYRAYGFNILLVRGYTKEGQPNIHVDLFEMGSSKNAYGVFSHDQEGEDIGIGQGSTYKDGLLSFWKDHFFVSLFSEEETGEAKSALVALAQKVASSIKKTGEKPQIISLLPLENLVENRIHYFFNHLILNYHFYVADSNIFLLDPQVEASLAQYMDNDESYHLLLVHYPEEKIASVAFQSFLKAYMPDANESALVQTEDEKWTAAKMKGSWLIIVFDALSESQAKKMIKRVEDKI